MTTFLNTNQTDFEECILTALNSKREMSVDVNNVVHEIISKVQQQGDDALCALTEQFDRLQLDPASLALDQSVIDEEAAKVSKEQLEALELAAKRIKDFHEKQMPQDIGYEDEIGVELGLRWTPMQSAGLYVPGGLASYPSSLLMNAIPAHVAGVERLVMMVPTPEGEINPLVMAAAKLLNITEIYPIGGAQAIAALAYGTEQIRSVDKIVGPGNAYVAAAKKAVYGTVGIDMIAGPSEVLIIADESANINWIAADLLAQAEHDPSAQSILITTDERIKDEIDQAVRSQLKTLPKAEIARQSWDDNGLIILAQSIDEACAISDRFAPEHLELMVNDPDSLLPKIKHAGAIFMGHYTPEAIGDYIGGPNHVLPTARSARFASGLSVFDFLKRTTLLKCGIEQLQQIGSQAIILSEAENLAAHGRSIAIRSNS